jgi:polyphosphate kinase
MIRVGRLYNYIDYNRKWLNKMGLQVMPFRDELLKRARASFQKQHEYFLQEVNPLCEASHFVFVQDITTLSHQEKTHLKHYFRKAVFPMLTPMVFDSRQVFPALANKLLVFGVVTHNPAEKKVKTTKKSPLSHCLRTYRVFIDSIVATTSPLYPLRQLYGSICLCSSAISLFSPSRSLG